MPRIVRALGVALLAIFLAQAARAAPDPLIARGKYLVTIGGCSDCHTPGTFLGRPDFSRYLGGSDVGFATPHGVFVPPNLTPDQATGLGTWSRAQIVRALTTGVRPDGRVLAPIMPWRSFAHLTRRDALAIATYLKSLPPVAHKVPGPLGPKGAPDLLVMAVLPGAVYATLPPPGAHARP
ncbi:MAG: cytochrome c [Rhodospirillales bacterium]|nr:cytochrome c [Rhodospirillales bacterium]